VPLVAPRSVDPGSTLRRQPRRPHVSTGVPAARDDAAHLRCGPVHQRGRRGNRRPFRHQTNRGSNHPGAQMCRPNGIDQTSTSSRASVMSDVLPSSVPCSTSAPVGVMTSGSSQRGRRGHLSADVPLPHRRPRRGCRTQNLRCVRRHDADIRKQTRVGGNHKPGLTCWFALWRGQDLNRDLWVMSRSSTTF
jgi:hypothetical protein